jgi:hypothetical protein
MNGEEQVALPWMAQFTRATHPDREVRERRSGQRRSTCLTLGVGAGLNPREIAMYRSFR